MAEQTANSLSVIESVNVSGIGQTIDKIGKFQELVKSQLKNDHDFGIIPGTQKPTLLKPGAEKILMLLGLTSEYELVEKVQDYDKAFFAFTVRCTLLKNDLKITEGLGHANTREKRYVSGKQGDAYTLANTVLKMAKKRSQVDATLTVAALSEIFTQDLEDMDLQHAGGAGHPQQAPQSAAKTTTADEDVMVKWKGEMVTIGSLPNHNLEWIADKSGMRPEVKDAAARIIAERLSGDKQKPSANSPMDSFAGSDAPSPTDADAPLPDGELPFDK